MNNSVNESNRKPKSIKKNYLYNLIYQLFGLITPLITMPYISRVLGSSGVGQYSFTFSLITYFIIFGSLGFGYYAQREIARYQGDKEEQTKVFFEILIARSCSVFVSLIVHILIILSGVYGNVYSILMWILTINIVSTAFDVSFLFQGNEEFGIIALRNVVIKIVGVVAIIVFVKNESHVWLYTLCQSIILLVSNLSLWTRLPKMLARIRFSELRVKRHFAPTLRLFIPTIAVSVYTILDKTLIGFLVPGTVVIDGVEKQLSDVENGFYDQSEKIVKMVMTIITSMGTVMIPRNSYEIASGNIEQFRKNINKTLKFVFFLGSPIMFGLAATAFNFSPWFFGNGFEKVPVLIVLMSPLVLIIGLSNVLGLQYLLPQKLDRKYTFAITSGAVINLILNIFLIRFIWSYGAAIATVVAEVIVTTMMFVFARKELHFCRIVTASWKYLVSGLTMFCIVFLTQFGLPSSIFNTLFLTAEGCFIYFSMLFLFQDSFITAFFLRIKNVFSKQN